MTERQVLAYMMILSFIFVMIIVIPKLLKEVDELQKNLEVLKKQLDDAQEMVNLIKEIKEHSEDDNNLTEN